MDNEELMKKALEAIKEVFNDTSVSQGQAYRNLQELIDEIEILQATLDEEDD